MIFQIENLAYSNYELVVFSKSELIRASNCLSFQKVGSSEFRIAWLFKKWAHPSFGLLDFSKSGLIRASNCLSFQKVDSSEFRIGWLFKKSWILRFE